LPRSNRRSACVWVTILLLLVSGYWMVFKMFGGFAGAGLQVGVRGGDARPGHGHHPTVHFDSVSVRVEEVEGVAPATADL
jgi:hypothetical protein